MNDPFVEPTLRWGAAFVPVGLVGTGYLVASWFPGNVRQRRSDLEKAYGRTIPERLASAVDRRLAQDSRAKSLPWLGAFVVAVLQTHPWIRAWGRGGAALAAAVIGMALVGSLRVLRASRPLTTGSVGVARVRSVTLADYVPRRLRVTARICELGILGLIGWGLWTDLHLGRGVAALFIAPFFASPVAMVEATSRLVVRAPLRAADDEQLFLQDALRTRAMCASYRTIVLGGTLYLFLILANVLPLNLIEVFALTGIVTWWSGRPASQWWIGNLWRGWRPGADSGAVMAS